jgi:hypothetical protein
MSLYMMVRYSMGEVRLDRPNESCKAVETRAVSLEGGGQPAPLELSK